jgi:hypothetical protein
MRDSLGPKKNLRTSAVTSKGGALDRAIVSRKEKLDGAWGQGERHSPPRRRCRQGGEARRPAAKGNRDRIALASLRTAFLGC